MFCNNNWVENALIVLQTSQWTLWIIIIHAVIQGKDVEYSDLVTTIKFEKLVGSLSGNSDGVCKID